MAKQQSSFKYLLAAIGAAFVWGFLTIPLQHLHGLGYSSQQILYYRVFASLTAMLLLTCIFRRKALLDDLSHYKQMPPAGKKKATALLLFTGIFITTNWFTYIYVVNHIGVKVAGFGYLICPLITAAGGAVFLKEKLTTIKLAGIALAIVSIAILSTGSVVQAIWSVVVALSYSVYLIIQRKMPGFDKLNVLTVQLIIAVLLLLPFYFYDLKMVPAESVFWIDTFIVAVVFTIIPLSLSLYALTGLPSSTVGITIYINPVLTFLVAFFYFHEDFKSNQLTGYILLVISVIIFNWELIAMVVKKNNRRSEPSF